MQKACVIGWPIKHSRSPLIHQYWLKKYAIAGSYEKQAVRPQDLKEFLTSMRENGLAGCNVTIPHKEKVFKLVTITDSITKRIGAVNTVFFENGELSGLNTDGYGFLSNLVTTTGWKSRDRVCSIIGSGGAARAIVATLIDDGIKTIFLFNRTETRSQKLAEEFGSAVKARPLEELESHLNQTDLLVNSTSLGMVGQPPLELSLQNLQASASVVDIVYDPLETDLLKQARANGNKAVDGLGMLLHQAVPGFQKWFGRLPVVNAELRDLVVADLKKGNLR